MTTASYHHPSRREILSDLSDRLKRVQAAGGTVKSLGDAQDATAAMLCDALQSLERDLLLAAHDAEMARLKIRR